MQNSEKMSPSTCGEVISMNGLPPTSHREHQEEMARPLDKCAIRGSGPVVVRSELAVTDSSRTRYSGNRSPLVAKCLPRRSDAFAVASEVALSNTSHKADLWGARPPR